MSLFMRHIIIPFLAPLLFFGVAATPVAVLGCRTRGLLAVIVALASVLTGIVPAFRALRGRRQNDPRSSWWAASALILSIPAIALLILG